MRWRRELAIPLRAVVVSVGLTALPLLAGATPPAGADVTELKFAELYRAPAGPRGLEPSPKLLALVGRRVRIVGYRVLQEQPMPATFILAPYAMSTAERSDGLADDLPPAVVYVKLAAGTVPPPPAGILAVEGTLEFGAREEEDGRVSWIRLRVEPPRPDPGGQP